MQPNEPWRGLVNQITYGPDLSRRADDATVQQVAIQLIGQRLFTRPVEEYFDAARSAVESRVPIAAPGADEQATRDFLQRLLQALYARKPWPEPLFRQVDLAELPDAVGAPRIGELQATQIAVTERLNRIFEPIPAAGGRRALLMRLPDRSVVALVAPASFGEPRIEVRSAAGDPAAVRAVVQRLTGAQVEAP